MSSPKYKLRMVDISKLAVDPSYQRDPDSNYAARLAEAWSWDECLPLVGNERDGLVYIVDGQHRLAAMRELGISETVPTLVYSGLTQPQEAQLFLAYNNTKTVQAVDKHRAKVLAGDWAAREIERVVRSAGLAIGKAPVAKTIRAVAALNKVYRTQGAEVLGRSLDIISTAFGTDAGVFQGFMIEGMGSFLGVAGARADERRAVRILRRWSVTSAIGTDWAKLARKETGGQGALGDGMRRALIAAYNRGLPKPQQV